MSRICLRLWVPLLWMLGAALCGCGCGPQRLATTTTHRQPVERALRLPEFSVHTLQNGLRVVLVEQPNHPIIGLSAYITTGGRTETAAYAGALHFIEHLVFKGGTRHFAPTEFRKTIAALGDESGGWTWDDEIQFGFEVPKRNFDRALKVFAESLLELEWHRPWLEEERKVVLQELKKTSARPWSRLWRAWDALAYLHHPYGRPVIGNPGTVKALRFEDLEAYYKARFVPNHMLLAVVGDFQSARMLTRIQRRFGGYPQGAASFELDNVAEPEQRAARHRDLSDPGTTTTRMLVGIRCPGAAADETPGLMLLAALLNSPTWGLPALLLHGQPQWALRVHAEYTFMVDYGQLVLLAEAQPDRAGTVSGALSRALSGLAERPFSADAVREAARGILIGRARSWEAAGEQAQGLGFWLERLGPEAARTFSARLMAYTPESLMALARRLLPPERHVEVVMHAPGAGMGPARGLPALPPPPPIPRLSGPGLTEPSTSPAWAVRQIARRGALSAWEVGPGLRVLVERRPGDLLVDTVAWIAGGQWVEPAGEAGVAALTGRLLMAGSEHLSRAQWDRLLSAETLSASRALRFGARSNTPRDVHARDGQVLALSGTRAQADLIVTLLGEALFRARFPDSEVKRALQSMGAEVDSVAEDSLELLKQAFYAHVFPRHPYGRPTTGTAATLARIDPASVRRFYARTYRPDRMTVAVVGDVEPARLVRAMAARWSDGHVRRAGPLPAPPVRVERPVHRRADLLSRGVTQWAVMRGGPTVDAADPAFVDLEVLTTIARGRHFYKYVYKLGVSYRSWIKLWAHRSPSLWILENDVAQKDFEATVAEIRRDLKAYGRGAFSAADLDIARASLKNRAELEAQSGLLTAFQRARNSGLGRSFDWAAARLRRLETLRIEDINRLARRVFGDQPSYELILR